MPPKPRVSGTTAVSAARRKEQAAARGESYRENEIDEVRRLGRPPMHDPGSAFPWLARVALLAVEGAATDPGLAPEAAREQLVRLIPQAVRAMDPARMAARIDVLEKALAEMVERDADRVEESPRGEVQRRETEGARAPADS